jgi:hypothetical protein
MSTSHALVESAPNLPATLGPDLAAAVDLAKAEKALSTRKAYGTDFRIFREWCDGKDVSSLPARPETRGGHCGNRNRTPGDYPTEQDGPGR